MKEITTCRCGRQSPVRTRQTTPRPRGPPRSGVYLKPNVSAFRTSSKYIRRHTTLTGTKICIPRVQQSDVVVCERWPAFGLTFLSYLRKIRHNRLHQRRPYVYISFIVIFSSILREETAYEGFHGVHRVVALSSCQTADDVVAVERILPFLSHLSK